MFLAMRFKSRREYDCTAPHPGQYASCNQPGAGKAEEADGFFSLFQLSQLYSGAQNIIKPVLRATLDNHTEPLHEHFLQ